MECTSMPSMKRPMIMIVAFVCRLLVFVTLNQTYGNTAQPFRCYSSSLWATKYVLIATPTICLSLFECDALFEMLFKLRNSSAREAQREQRSVTRRCIDCDWHWEHLAMITNSYVELNKRPFWREIHSLQKTKKIEVTFGLTLGPGGSTSKQPPPKKSEKLF